jgi:hypothetical protein
MDEETFFKSIEEFLKRTKLGVGEYEKDFHSLSNFTNEELAEELCRRTSLGKELE